MFKSIKLAYGKWLYQRAVQLEQYAWGVVFKNAKCGEMDAWFTEMEEEG